MSLLALQHVCKRYSRTTGERTVLRDVTLELEPGELAVVWGLKGSGRSTLLRIAAGIEAPDSGSVRFEGRDIAEVGEGLLGGGIGFPERGSRSAEGRGVLDHVIVGLLAHGVGPRRARTRALAALERVGAEQTARQRLAAARGGRERARRYRARDNA